MKDFILFMYDDVVDKAIAGDGARWEKYSTSLHASGAFDGGSSIGAGVKYKKNHPNLESEPGANGFIRIRADSQTEAKSFLIGNPNYEAGGTVEIRELPRGE